MRVACLQLCSGPDAAANLAQITGLADQARQQGAAAIFLPENAVIFADRAHYHAVAAPMADHPLLAPYGVLAARLAVPLLVGSVPVREGEEIRTRSVLFAADGSIAAHYDKLHLFDVDLPDGESYRESATYQPGDRAVLAPLLGRVLGLSICYDLRFAALYRALAQAGAEILAIPSSFTVPTGQAHWHVLLRARAIETASFVLAPAQAGAHPHGRQTYGHTLIVDPWGQILAEAAGHHPQIVLADLNLAQVGDVRGRLPALRHDRAFGRPA